MDKASRWIGPLVGVLFVFAIFGAIAIAGEFESEPSDSATRVLTEFRDKADDIQAAGMLTLLGIGLLVIFLGYLRSKMRAAGAGWAADAFLAGGVVLAGAWIVMVGIQLAGGVAGEHGHIEVVQGALDFMWEGTLIFSPGLLAVGVAAAVASFAYRALPIWLGIFAVIVALGALAPWMGIFVFVLWVLAVSIDQGVRAARPVAVADVR